MAVGASIGVLPKMRGLSGLSMLQKWIGINLREN